MAILGVILAGGAARRFGSDKALAPLGGRPLIEHAIAALRPVVEQIVISGRVYQDYCHLPDRPQPGLGPLGGLNAALHYAAAHDFSAALSAPCDVPAYPADLLERLASNGDPAMLGALPVCGYWPSRLAPMLDQHLRELGNLSIRRWADRIGAAILDTPAPLWNINYPADLNGIEPDRKG